MRTSPGILESSFRDPSGFIFVRDGAVFRQINRRYQEDYDRLMSSGLYDDLVGRGLLIPHCETTEPPLEPETAYKVVRPDRLEFISYPYEWGFGALKDAALATLQVQKSALAHGMSLKDASAFNIQFLGLHPVLIDTLSFESLEEVRPWAAYGQFCRHFLAPLALTSYTGQWLNALLGYYLDGVPLEMASAMLPARSRLRFSILSHIHLHASSIARAARGTGAGQRESRAMGRNALQGLVDHLESAVRSLEWKASKATAWSGYYGKTSYTSAAFEAKRSFVDGAIGEIRPGSVWDLGANTGEFSRLASKSKIFTLALDADPACVEANYRTARADQDAFLLPLVMDLSNPTPGLGWEGLEREAFLSRGPADMALALALVHHLCISRNIPLGKLCRLLARVCRWLVIEFVPKDDPQVREMLLLREDIFGGYAEGPFEEAMGERFDIVRKEKLPESPRTIYLMKVR